MSDPNLHMSHLKSIALFPSRLDSYAVPDSDRFNLELLAVIEARRSIEPGIESSNQIGWHSARDLFSREEEPFRRLTRYIRGALIDSVRRYWPAFNPDATQFLMNGWVNVNGPGAFNAPHAHGGFHLSGCYYVSVPQSAKGRSGYIEFLNPAGAVTTLEDGFSQRAMRLAHRIQPQAGQLLIFPAYLRHWVYPNQEAEDRVTIAFNMRVLDGEN